MTAETFNHVCHVLLIMFVLQSGIHVLASTCGKKNFSENLVAKEGRFSNVTYLLNSTKTTSLEQTSIFFDICHNDEMTNRCKFKWGTQVNNMIVENWGSGNQTSCFSERLGLNQSMLTWKLTISQLVDRSLSVMHLYDEDSEMTVQTLHLISVDVLYPSRITNLTVDGQEAGNTQLIDRSQEGNISCYYEKGNPAETFHLMDKHGNEVAKGDIEGNLAYLLTAQCEDDWPTVHCEGNVSQQTRSVSFLVRCPPQFVDSSVTIITPPELETKTFRVKAHNTSMTECYLTSSSSVNNSRQESRCTLTGTPPYLVLTLHLNEVGITQGNWRVILGNELGSTNTTISIMDTRGVQHTATLDGVLIGLPCGAVLLTTVIVFVMIRVKTLIRQQNHGRTDGRNGSIELQGDVTTMIVNDVYESSGGLAGTDAMKSPSHLDAPPLPPPRTPRAHDGGCASTPVAYNQEAHNHPGFSVVDVRERKKISKNKVRIEDRQDGACTPSSFEHKKGKQANESRTRVTEETDEAIAPPSLVTPSTSQEC